MKNQMINGYEVQVQKSRRKTLSVQIREGRLLVKAPLLCTDQQIGEFLQKHQRWIQTHMERAEEHRAAAGEAGMLTPEEIKALAEEALIVIPPKVKQYAALMEVSCGRITIRAQRTRWGSCSRQGNLNFNCLLMLCPDEVIDSVVVHELAHRKEMNHSARFYEEVLKAYPAYYEWNRWLKENGAVLLERMIQR